MGLCFLEQKRGVYDEKNADYEQTERYDARRRMQSSSGKLQAEKSEAGNYQPLQTKLHQVI